MLQWTVHIINAPNRNDFQQAVAVDNELYSFVADRINIRSPIDVYILNTVALLWRKLTPVTPGNGRQRLEVPSKRSGYTAVLVGDTVYIWGGCNALLYTVDDDNVLFAFDVDSHTWFTPRVSGNVPEGRWCHSACVVEKVMFIHGGWTRTERTNVMYKLDTTTMVWSVINSRDTAPPRSTLHSATIIGTKMCVFGGNGDQGEKYNTISVFDTETNSWLDTPSAQPLPEGRCGHSAFTYNGELYICGGLNDSQNLKDLWKFSPETLTWKEVKPKGNGPLTMICGCCCIVGDRIILFRGSSDDGLFILDLSPRLKTLSKLAVIQYGLEQSELPHDIRWELAAMTTKS